LFDEETVKSRSEQIKQQIKKAKDDYKQLVSTLKTEEPNWKQLHEKRITLEEAIRNTKNKSKTKENKKTKTELEVEELRKRKEVLQKSIKAEEAKHKREIAAIETSKKTTEQELNSLKTKIQERSRDLQLKEIKIKEFRNRAKNIQIQLGFNEKLKEKESSEESKDSSDAEVNEDTHQQDYFSKPNLK